MDMEQQQTGNIFLIGYHYSGVEILERLLSTIMAVPSLTNNSEHRPIVQRCIGHPEECTNIQITSTSKIVFIVRNVKDIAVAMYMNSNVAHTTKFEDFLLDRYLFGNSVERWCDHIQQWQTTLANHPASNLHLIYYKDFIQDLEEETQKLCEFLDINKSRQEVSQLCTLLRRDMDQPQKKRRKTNHVNNNFDTYSEDISWKQYFTVSQQEQMDHLITNMLQSTNLHIHKLIA